MKRITAVIVLAAMLFLSGCQPTPEVEYVVNKGDNKAEEKINLTPLPTAVPKPTGSGETQEPSGTEGNPQPTGAGDELPWQDAVGQPVFPERWEDDIRNDYTEILISADVITGGLTSYPVRLVRPTDFTNDDLLRIANYMFRDVTGWRKGDCASREYLMDAMAFLAASDIDEETKREQLEALRMDLADTEFTDADIVPCSSLEGVPVGAYGVTVYTENGAGGMCRIGKRISFRTNLYGTPYAKRWDRYDFEFDPSKYTPTISLEEAVTMAEEFFDAVGIEGFELYDHDEARCINVYTLEQYDTGWELDYIRSYGYAPYSVTEHDASESGPFRFSDKFTEFSAPVKEELITLYVTESGVKDVTMDNPYEDLGTVNENVQLIDFETLTLRIRMLLTAAINNPHLPEGYFLLEKLVLTVVPQQKKDSSDYYMMPVWVCVLKEYYSMDGPLYAHYYSPGEQKEIGWGYTIAFNAIDGSRVNLPQR